MSQIENVSANHPEMDAEHKVQIGLIQALDLSLQQGQGRSDISSILSQLVEYTNVHFMSEQLLMRLHAYPDIGGHEMEHDHLIEQLRKVEAGFVAGDSEMTASEITMLKRLVIDHIRTHDQTFAKYLAEPNAGLTK